MRTGVHKSFAARALILLQSHVLQSLEYRRPYREMDCATAIDMHIPSQIVMGT